MIRVTFCVLLVAAIFIPSGFAHAEHVCVIIGEGGARLVADTNLADTSILNKKTMLRESQQIPGLLQSPYGLPSVLPSAYMLRHEMIMPEGTLLKGGTVVSKGSKLCIYSIDLLEPLERVPTKEEKELMAKVVTLTTDVGRLERELSAEKLANGMLMNKVSSLTSEKEDVLRRYGLLLDDKKELEILWAKSEREKRGLKIKVAELTQENTELRGKLMSLQKGYDEICALFAASAERERELRAKLKAPSSEIELALVRAELGRLILDNDSLKRRLEGAWRDLDWYRTRPEVVRYIYVHPQPVVYYYHPPAVIYYRHPCY